MWWSFIILPGSDTISYQIDFARYHQHQHLVAFVTWWGQRSYSFLAVVARSEPQVKHPGDQSLQGHDLQLHPLAVHDDLHASVVKAAIDIAANPFGGYIERHKKYRIVRSSKPCWNLSSEKTYEDYTSWSALHSYWNTVIASLVLVHSWNQRLGLFLYAQSAIHFMISRRSNE